jgi:hypothetical protein
MLIDLRYSGMQLSATEQQPLQALVQDTLRLALRHQAARVERASLHFSDVNGPRGGEDKVCLLNLKLRGAPAVVVRERGQHLAALVHQVAARAAQTLTLQVRRQLQQRRRSGAATSEPGLEREQALDQAADVRPLAEA